MARMHRRDPRGDWSLEFRREHEPFGYIPPGSAWNSPGQYLLSMAVTQAEAQQLLDRRGSFSFQLEYSFARPCPYARDIEVTPAEASQIVAGTHPRDVLFPVYPRGYRLYAVPDPFITGNW
jgi:hypothetical protein